jgi:hypothetical protein
VGVKPVEKPWTNRRRKNPNTVVSIGYKKLQTIHTVPPKMITGFRPMLSASLPLNGREIRAVSVNSEMISPLCCAPFNDVRNAGSSGISMLKLA